MIPSSSSVSYDPSEIILIWNLSNISYYFQCCATYYFVCGSHDTFCQNSLINRKLKNNSFYLKYLTVFYTVVFDQFNMSVLNIQHMQAHSLSVSFAEVNCSFSQQKKRGTVRSFAFPWIVVFSYSIFALSSQKPAWFLRDTPT